MTLQHLGLRIYEFLFDYGQHMHTYGTQTMYCFLFMCFPVNQGQIVALQLFMTWSWPQWLCCWMLVKTLMTTFFESCKKHSNMITEDHTSTRLGIYISYIIMKISYIYLHFASIHATTLDTQALVWFHPLLEILRFYVCSGWWCAQFVGHSSWFANLRIVRRSQKHKPKLRLMQFLVGCLFIKSTYLLARYSITQVSILFHLFQLDHWFLAELRCKIGPWFKYLNVSNLWSAKYMVSMPWSDFFRRTMYKGPMDRRFRMVLLYPFVSHDLNCNGF